MANKTTPQNFATGTRVRAWRGPYAGKTGTVTDSRRVSSDSDDGIGHMVELRVLWDDGQRSSQAPADVAVELTR